MMHLFPLIPAKAGIQPKENGAQHACKLLGKNWVPASAGTSGEI
jgi:hypothetical protein